jgi:putative ABC transport system permease protein
MPLIRLRLIRGLLRGEPVRHGIVLLSVAIGLGFAIGTAATVEGMRQGVSRSAERFPLVVGPKVGPVALVLGTMTRLQDLPAGLPDSVLERIRSDPRVAAAIPLLGGHGVKGVPILATSAAFLEPRRDFPIARGRAFNDGEPEAVLGDQAARSLGLKPGDHLNIEHAHEEFPPEAGSLLVTGVLEPRPDEADGTIFCPTKAIFESHKNHGAGHGDHSGQAGHAVSAVLVRPASDSALSALQEDLLALPGVEVALTGQTLRRVVDHVSGGTRLLSLLVIGIGAVTFLTLALGLNDLGRSWTRAVAVLRVMGANRKEVLLLVASAASIMVSTGIAGGLLVGWGIGAAGAGFLSSSLGISAGPVFLAPGVGRVILVFGGLFLLAVLQPVLSATSKEVAVSLRGQPGNQGRSSRAVLRLLVPTALFLVINSMMSQHGAKGVSLPPDAPSLKVFSSLVSWRGEGPLPDVLAGMDGGKVRIQGYMVSAAPYSSVDFNLVSQNPNLPKCPFCYRAPTRWERIRIRASRPVDVTKGLVTVEGTFRLNRDGTTPGELEMKRLEVVLEAKR